MCIRTEMHTRGLIDLVYLQSISSSSRQASLTIGSVHATRGALKLRRAPGTNGPTVRESKPPSRFATTTPAAMSVSTDEENPSVVHQAKLVSVEVSTPGNHAAVLAELALYREEAERLRRVTPARTSCCPGAWTSLTAVNYAVKTKRDLCLQSVTHLSTIYQHYPSIIHLSSIHSSSPPSLDTVTYGRQWWTTSPPVTPSCVGDGSEVADIAGELSFLPLPLGVPAVFLQLVACASASFVWSEHTSACSTRTSAGSGASIDPRTAPPFSLAVDALGKPMVCEPSSPAHFLAVQLMSHC